MTDLIKIAVDAMGGDNSPNKIIDGLTHHHKKNNISINSFFMKSDYLNLYNNLIKLTTNKFLYKGISSEIN